MRIQIPYRIITLILLAVCGLLAIAASVIGIDDNPPGILLAFLAATAFILAFVHPWRTPRKFLFLLLASVLGFGLFIILNILLDSITQNPATSDSISESDAEPHRRRLEFDHRSDLPFSLHRWRCRLDCHIHSQPSPAGVNPLSSSIRGCPRKPSTNMDRINEWQASCLPSFSKITKYSGKIRLFVYNFR